MTRAGRFIADTMVFNALLHIFVVAFDLSEEDTYFSFVRCEGRLVAFRPAMVHLSDLNAWVITLDTT